VAACHDLAGAAGRAAAIGRILGDGEDHEAVPVWIADILMAAMEAWYNRLMDRLKRLMDSLDSRLEIFRHNSKWNHHVHALQSPWISAG
jgi:hypothetical protein